MRSETQIISFTPLRCLCSKKLRYRIAEDRSTSDTDNKAKLVGEDQRHRGKARTAITVQAHHKMKFGSGIMLHSRSRTAEISLHSGAEYSVFLLVEVGDEIKPVRDDPVVYQKVHDNDIF